MDAKNKHSRSWVVIALLCLCIVVCTLGGVNAYLTSRTEPVDNEFVPAKVSCIVEETFENGVKTDAKVRNTGNIDAYIRAAVIVTFVSEDGKVLATAPREGVNYTLIWDASGWTKGTDGYWYHKSPVAPEGLTGALIESAAAISAPTGYRLNIQIAATAIQATPDTAVQEAWGITPTNGELIPNQ